MKGRKHSDVSKEKNRIAHAGNNNKLLGTHRSEETRRKISLLHKERFKKLRLITGVSEKTSLSKQIRNSFEYRQWRGDVFLRDNYTCQICNRRNSRNDKVTLNADHIKPLYIILNEFNILSMEDALLCEELWNMNNGRTLCVECHRKTDTFGYKIHRFKMN